MICYHCKNIVDCKTFQSLYDMSQDFDINHCANYDDAPDYKYKRIAEHDNLMHAIYDYFTGQIKGFDDEYAKEVIARSMWNL